MPQTQKLPNFETYIVRIFISPVMQSCMAHALASLGHTEGYQGLEDTHTLVIEGVIPIWQGVRRALDLGRLAKRLREQLTVSARRRPVAVAPNGEDLHRRWRQGLLACH